MFGNLFKASTWRKPGTQLEAQNENAPQVHYEGEVDPEKVRALRTGAALAVSLDASPAVLVNIYDYAHRMRGSRRR